MLIRCPTCLKAYELPPEILTGRGTMLRCAACRDSWALVDVEQPKRPPGFQRRPHIGPEIVAEARSARRGSAGPAFSRAGPALAPLEPRRSMSPAFAVAILLAVLAGGMASVARKDLVVRLYPPSAGLFAAFGLPVNLRGLALADMHGSLAARGSGSVLTLQGTISNLRREPTEVPALRIAVRDKDRNELYSWTAPAPKPRLDAGETVVFRSRLAAPPKDGQDVMIRFAESAVSPVRARPASR